MITMYCIYLTSYLTRRKCVTWLAVSRWPKPGGESYSPSTPGWPGRCSGRVAGGVVGPCPGPGGGGGAAGGREYGASPAVTGREVGVAQGVPGGVVRGVSRGEAKGVARGAAWREGGAVNPDGNPVGGARGFM